MVPTPQITSGNLNTTGGIVLPDNSSNMSVISSFSVHLPMHRGLKEELQEINFSTGVEYWYNHQFAVRAGYFSESEYKGNRKFFSTGLGIKMNICSIDFSYLVPIHQNNPLANTIRFTLLFDVKSFNRSKRQ